MDALVAASHQPDRAVQGELRRVEQVLADCQRQLARYRATLDAGGDPATVTAWINQATAEQAAAQARRAQLRTTTPAAVTTEQLRAIITGYSSLPRLLDGADPARRARLYAELGVQGVYDPAARVVEVTADVVSRWFVSEKGLDPFLHAPRCAARCTLPWSRFHPRMLRLALRNRP